MTESRPEPTSVALRLLHRAWRPPAHSDRPPPIWNWPPLQRRFFPDRPSLFPNRLVPLLLLLVIFVAARWLLYLLVLYYFFRSARLLVWHLFGDAAPSDVQDPTVTRIKRLRTWTAPTVSLVLLASFAPEDVLQEKVSEPLFTLIVAPWLLVATATVVIGILIRCAPPEQRPAMRTALRKPLRKLGYYAGTLLLPYGLLIGFVLWGPEGGVDLNNAGWPIQAAVVAFVWLALVFLFASARVVRTGFGLDTVHPALPALLTGILVWECFALNGMPGGPPAVACLLFLGGPIMVSAIVWWELHRLRVSHGVTLRGGRPARGVRDQFVGERVGGGDSDLIRSAAHMYHAAERRDVRDG